MAALDSDATGAEKTARKERDCQADGVGVNAGRETPQRKSGPAKDNAETERSRRMNWMER